MARKSRTAAQAQDWEMVSASVDDTQSLGERLGRLLQPGDVVGLEGELGSGKTTFVQGVARGLGRDSQAVKSPTFVLVREYPGPTPLIHVDGYRLSGASAAAWLDLDLLISPGKITLIEWADRFAGVLPEDHLVVAFAHVSANRRRLTMRATGPRSAAIVRQLPAEAAASAAATDAEDEQAAEPEIPNE